MKKTASSPYSSLLGPPWSGRWEAAAWCGAFLLPLVIPRHAAAIAEIAIFALFTVSLDLILGYAGIVSLGQAAFFGLGAYTAALMAKHVVSDPLIGLVVAMTASMSVGFLTSFTIHRGSDLSRLMVTLGIALLFLELANKLDWLTGGADGLQGAIIGPVLGVFEFDLAGRTAAYYALSVLFVCVLLVRKWLFSPFGVSLRAIRDNRLRATMIGIPVASRLTAIYTLGAGLAGISGAMLTHTTGFASLDVFDFHRSADALLMLVVGGAGWLYGGVFGAVVFKMMHDLLSVVTPQYWTFWLGLFLMLLVLVGRERFLRPWLLVCRKEDRGDRPRDGGPAA